MNPLVGLIMGSKSDWSTLEHAANTLDVLGVPHEVRVVSAHRTPDLLFEYAGGAEARGLEVIIAGAGGAAHLPGMVASMTSLPVIGVPIKSSNSMDGWDSVLSILQMPQGVPVATVALDGSKNAGILAAQIIGTMDEGVAKKLDQYKETLKAQVLGTAQDLEKSGLPNP